MEGEKERERKKEKKWKRKRKKQKKKKERERERRKVEKMMKGRKKMLFYPLLSFFPLSMFFVWFPLHDRGILRIWRFNNFEKKNRH